MADQSVEVRFGFRRLITCGTNQAEVDRRVEDMRKRLERELQLATKDNTLKLLAQPSYTPAAIHPRTMPDVGRIFASPTQYDKAVAEAKRAVEETNKIQFIHFHEPPEQCNDDCSTVHLDWSITPTPHPYRTV